MTMLRPGTCKLAQVVTLVLTVILVTRAYATRPSQVDGFEDDEDDGSGCLCHSARVRTALKGRCDGKEGRWSQPSPGGT